MAKPTRFPYGFALGWENQFNSYAYSGRGTGTNLPAGQQQSAGFDTAGLLFQASTGPDVSMGNLFYSANTTTTVISLLRTNQMGRAGQSQGGGAFLSSGQVDTTSPPPEGKIIRLFFLDNSTSLAQGGSGGIGNIILNSSDNGVGPNSIIDFMASNGSWWQIGPVSRPSVGMGFSNFSIGTASSINIANVNVATITGTATPVQVKALSGGQVGQIVRIFGASSSGISAYLMTGGNVNIVGTNMYLIPNSGYLEIMKINATLWNMLEIGTSAGVN